MDQREKIKWDNFNGKKWYKIPSGVKKSSLKIFSFDGKVDRKW
jgi:hypothetical protein